MATFADASGLTGSTARGADASGLDRAVKVSVAIPRSLWGQARAIVGDGSLSALVTEAVRRELAGRRTDAMLDELDEIHGPVPADVRAEVEAELGPLAHRTGH